MKFGNTWKLQLVLNQPNELMTTRCQNGKVRGCACSVPTGLRPSPVTHTCLSHAPATEHSVLGPFTLTSLPPRWPCQEGSLPYPAHVNAIVLQKPAISFPLGNLPWFPGALRMAPSIVLCLIVLHFCLSYSPCLIELLSYLRAMSASWMRCS